MHNIIVKELIVTSFLGIIVVIFLTKYIVSSLSVACKICHWYNESSKMEIIFEDF